MPSLPKWAQAHDLATVVEFTRMTQRVLDSVTSNGTDPTSAEVIEYVGTLSHEFTEKFADVEWGESADFLEETERFFEAAPHPLWLPWTPAEVRAAAAAKRESYEWARDIADRQDAAGCDLTARLSHAGVRCRDFGDGVIEVDWDREDADLRVIVCLDPETNVCEVDVGSYGTGDDNLIHEVEYARGLHVGDTDAILSAVRYAQQAVG